MGNQQRYHPRWFSRLRGDDINFTRPEDFTPAFWREVAAIRQKFHLINESFGIDRPLNIPESWQSYLINDPAMGLSETHVKVAFSRFEWNHIEPSQEESFAQPLVPRFRLAMHLALPTVEQEKSAILGQPKPPRNLDLPAGYTLIHSSELIIEFHSRHPICEPRPYISGRPQDADPHAHHWFIGGDLCISPFSQTDEGWEQSGRSTVRWIALAVAWSTWHVREFGY